jgi:hypothetical protein
MKAVLILHVVIVSCYASASAHTDAPPDYQNETAEMIAIGSSTAFTFLNVVGLAEGRPSYWLGVLGTGSGIVALGLMTSDDVRFERSLFVTATISAVTGLVAVIQRSLMKTQMGSVRLEPDGHKGSMGLALAIDF